MQAVDRFRAPGEDSRAAARKLLAELSEKAITGFPATILPNPFLQELRALAKSADVTVPLTEELAADIFEGKFSPKFAAAADLAAGVLKGSPYERYYHLDYAGWLNLQAPGDRQAAFGQLVSQAAGSSTSWSVAGNGKIIEQAQIFTTHNLAALVHVLDLQLDWPDLSCRAFIATAAKLRGVDANPRPLRSVKDSAYAWRQLMFFLSFCTPEERTDFLTWTRSVKSPASVIRRLDPVLADLGRTFQGQAPAQPYLAWTVLGAGWRHGFRRGSSPQAVPGVE